MLGQQGSSLDAILVSQVHYCRSRLQICSVQYVGINMMAHGHATPMTCTIPDCHNSLLLRVSILYKLDPADLTQHSIGRADSASLTVIVQNASTNHRRISRISSAGSIDVYPWYPPGVYPASCTSDVHCL